VDHFIKDSLDAAQNIALAGMKGGYEIAQAENAAKIAQLESDCLVLALRLYGESPDTFAPETKEVMRRWGPKCSRVLMGEKP